MTDLQMIEDVGKAKGKKMIDKTLEALKRSNLLQDKFREVVNKINKEKRRQMSEVRLNVSKFPETKEEKVAKIRTEAQRLSQKIKEVQIQKSIRQSLHLQRKMAHIHRWELLKQQSILKHDIEERLAKSFKFSRVW